MIIGLPPIYEDAKKAFNLKDGAPIYFTYGDTIYNPTGVEITDELIRHEETHMEQQQFSREVAVLWWQRYIQDAEWRVEQEAEAYGNQYALYCQKEKDRNKRVKYLHKIAGYLSSEMYGNAIDHKGAREKIDAYAHLGRVLK